MFHSISTHLPVLIFLFSPFLPQWPLYLRKLIRCMFFDWRLTGLQFSFLCTFMSLCIHQWSLQKSMTKAEPVLTYGHKQMFRGQFDSMFIHQNMRFLPKPRASDTIAFDQAYSASHSFSPVKWASCPTRGWLLTPLQPCHFRISGRNFINCII